MFLSSLSIYPTHIDYETGVIGRPLISSIHLRNNSISCTKWNIKIPQGIQLYYINLGGVHACVLNVCLVTTLYHNIAHHDLTCSLILHSHVEWLNIVQIQPQCGILSTGVESLEVIFTPRYMHM